MGAFAEQILPAIATQATGGLIGQIFAGANDRRQLRQQAKLNQMAIDYNKAMGAYNLEQQMALWHRTGYKAQLQQLKDAGLSPGLIYGMGGAGGTTAAATSSAAPQGAPVGGGEAQAGMAMMLQTQIAMAQKKLIEAQADNVEAETDALRGYKKDEAKARTESLLQGIDNQRQQHEILKVDLALKRIDEFEKLASQQDRLDFIEYQTERAKAELQSATAIAYIDKATVQQKVQIIQQTAIGAVLNNLLTQAQTTNVKATTEQTIANTHNIRAKTGEIAQRLMMDWDKMSQENRRITIQQQLADWNTDINRHYLDKGIDAIQSIFDIFKNFKR